MSNALAVLWWAALWGGVGALLVEMLDLYGAIRRTGTFPWKVKGGISFSVYVFVAGSRLVVGSSFAGVVTLSDPSDRVSVLPGILAGVGAVVLVERLGKLIAVDDPFRQNYTFDDSIDGPKFYSGEEPPNAKIRISRRSVAVLESLVGSDILEAVAVDVGLTLPEVRNVVSYLQKRGYVRLDTGSSRDRLRITDSGVVLLRRLARKDPAVVIATSSAEEQSNEEDNGLDASNRGPEN